MLALGVGDHGVHHPHPPQRPHPPAVLWGRKQQVLTAQFWGLWEELTGQGIQEGFLVKVALSGDMKDQ